MNLNHIQNIQNVMDDAVFTKQIAGCNCLIYQNGKEIAYYQAGFSDIENKKLFERNTICRLFSMTKPVTAVAALKLIEMGKLDIYQWVSDIIPEFSNLNYCDMNDGGKIKKCSRPLFVKDLLNMTSGYSYGGNSNESEKMISDLLYNQMDKIVSAENNISTLDFAKKLSQIPLSFEPGTDYQYGLSADILGAVIETVSKMRFGDFLKKYIFEPLGMNDTAFYVPSEKQHFLSKVYEKKNNQLVKYENNHLGIQNAMEKDPLFESGGAGLTSTIDDYMKFCLMLVNKGEYDGKRILQPKTVEFLYNSRLSDNLQKCFDLKMEHLQGYTYCNLNRICIDKGKNWALTENNEFGWDGWLGPYMSVDVKNQLTIVYLQQMTDAGTTPVTRKIKNIIYSSL